MKQHITALGSPGPKVPPSQDPGSRYNRNYSEGGNLEILHVQHQDTAFPRSSRHHSPYSQESVHICCPVFSSPNAILPASTDTRYLPPCSHRWSLQHITKHIHAPGPHAHVLLAFQLTEQPVWLVFQEPPLQVCWSPLHFHQPHHWTPGPGAVPLTLPISSEPDAIPGVLHQDWEDSHPHLVTLGQTASRGRWPWLQGLLTPHSSGRPMRCNRVEFPTQATRFSLAKLLLFQDHGGKSG